MSDTLHQSDAATRCYWLCQKHFSFHRSAISAMRQPLRSICLDSRVQLLSHADIWSPTGQRVLFSHDDPLAETYTAECKVKWPLQKCNTGRVGCRGCITSSRRLYKDAIDRRFDQVPSTITFRFTPIAPLYEVASIGNHHNDACSKRHPPSQRGRGGEVTLGLCSYPEASSRSP